MNAKAIIHQLNQTLHQRTRKSLALNRRLKQTVLQRRKAEDALKKRAAQRTKLLAESRRLQKHLRHLTHEILLAQEDELRKTSRLLHDEIAQSLLAIDLRLLTLKTSAKATAENLKKEIANTQRIVKQFVKRVNRFAHECGIQHKKT